MPHAAGRPEMDGTRANKNTSMPYEKRMPVLELEEKASCMQFWSAEIKATMTKHFSTGGKSAPTFEDPCFEEQATSSTSRCELMLPGLASRTGPLATERHLHTKRHGATPCALRQPAPYGPLRPGCTAATSRGPRGQTVGPRRASIAGQARPGEARHHSRRPLCASSGCPRAAGAPISQSGF